MSFSGKKSLMKAALACSIAATTLLATPVVTSAASITVTATIRDFSSAHADFQQGVGTLEPGIVLSALGPDGKPVYNEALKGATGASSTTTNGTANFNQWYNSTDHVFTTSLVANETAPGSGVFAYSNASYFPINGQGFGNQGNSTNFHFTTEINTEFTYVGGESFSFSGDDDVWVFINGELAIDLGGVHGPESDTVSLDSAAAALGISIGNTYDLSIFHAERQTSGSNFNFTTSIALVDAPAVSEPGVLAILMLGLGGIAVSRRRKADRKTA
ncbi:MAG: fibro-slime domain-containing protein [Paracoccaceae bacterium]|jgi:fibro-slime domain-containing protein